MLYYQSIYTRAEVHIVRKTFKTGNGIVISLQREALENFGIKESAQVSVELDREHQQIVIAPKGVPISMEGVDEEFTHQVQ